MKTLHGPIARNNRHIYLAYIEFLNGVDARAITIGDPASLNSHIQDDSFQDFLAKRVTFIPRGPAATSFGLLKTFFRTAVLGRFDVVHFYSLYSFIPLPIDLRLMPGLQGWANADVPLLRAIDRLQGGSVRVFLHFQGCDLRTPAQYDGLYAGVDTMPHVP